MARAAQGSSNEEIVISGRRTIFRGLILAGVLSAFINLLQMLVPLYMLQVHDRVINSQSIDTLVMLSILAVAGLALYGFLEFLRGTTLLIVGAQFVSRLNLPLIEAALHRSIIEGASKATQSLRDLTDVRTFFSSGVAGAPLEAIWSPIFMLTLTLLHPIYGVISLVSACLVLSFSLIGDLISKRLLKDATTAQVDVIAGVGASLRHAEVIDAMGMLTPLGRRWQKSQALADQMFEIGMRRNKMVSAASKTVRYGMQVATLALGAVLSIDHVITPGVMVAASILMVRTLSPFDAMIENWRQWRSATGAWRRIEEALMHEATERQKIALPRPEGALVVENLVYVVPGSATPMLRGLDFSIVAGEMLGVIGPSASGKSTFARLLVGIIAPTAGGIFLGGHNVATWERNSFGRIAGYLPQNVALLDGTIAENISRLNDDDPTAVIAAARAAGVHEMIGRLPLGYDTPTGDSRLSLSGGQKQRIGIARAIYGTPNLVVFDEPNANLDAEGEQALVRAIVRLKATGAMVVVIAHRPAILQAADKLLVLQKDHTWQFGPTDSITAILDSTAQEPAPLKLK